MTAISFKTFIDIARQHEGDESQRLVLSERDQQASELVVQDSGFVSWITGEERVQNQRAWGTFFEAIESVNRYFPDRIRRMGKRFDLDFEKQREAGEALRVRHIVQYGIAAAIPTVEEVEMVADKTIRSGIKVKDLTADQLCRCARELNPFHFLGKHKHPTRIYGGSESWVSYSRLGMARNYAALASTCATKEERASSLRARRAQGDSTENWWGLFDTTANSCDSPKTWLQFFDRFSKAMISYEPIVGTLVPVPLERPDGEDCIEFYRVERPVGKEGLVAYVLVPTRDDLGLPAFLSFRQTQPQLRALEGPKSIFNDFERHIGQSGYNASKEQLLAIFEDPALRQYKFVLGSYSLGGAFLQRLIADLTPEMLARIQEAHFWCGPYIDKATCLKFANKINHNPEYRFDRPIPIPFTIYRNKGDPTPHFGERHLGYDVQNPSLQFKVIQHEDKVENRDMLPGMSPHKARPYDRNKEELPKTMMTPTVRQTHQELLFELDNEAREAYLEANNETDLLGWESVRLSWLMQTLHCLIVCVYYFLEAFFALLGCKVFRTVEDLSNP